MSQKKCQVRLIEAIWSDAANLRMTSNSRPPVQPATGVGNANHRSSVSMNGRGQ